MKKLRVKNKAFTLVELLLVVGIIALGSVVAYITLPKVQSTARANAEANNINTLAAGIRNIYVGINNFNNLSNRVTVLSQATPFNMQVTGAPDIITNSFGGQVNVAPASLGNANGVNGSFSIQYTQVPIQECVKLALGVGNNFSQVSVNSVLIKEFPSTAPISQVEATNNCNQDANEMMFYGV